LWAMLHGLEICFCMLQVFLVKIVILVRLSAV
jgi:hypothetical protein